MTASMPDEILCRTRLTATQAIAMILPRPALVVVGMLMFVIWLRLVSVMDIAATLLVAAICLPLLKLALVAFGMTTYPWRVVFDGDRVEFYQGSHRVDTCLMTVEEVGCIAVVDSRWSPRRLQITRTDGTSLETLFGVCQADLDRVTEKLNRLIAAPARGEES